MKILFVLELYHPNIGGIEKLFKSLAEALAAQGHEVCVITTRFRKDLPAREFINGVRVKRLKLRSRFLFTFFGIFSVLGEARKSDIIHTTSYNAAFPARLAGWIARKKVIITFHEVWGKLWFKLPYINLCSKTLFYLYEQFILRLGFYRFIAPSDYTASCLRKSNIKPNKVFRIYNGLDYKDYDPDDFSPPGAFTYTYFGRLGSSKGLDLIISASANFLKNHPDAHLKLIIPKVPPAFYKKIIQQLKQLPSDNYSLLHNLERDELHKHLQHSSCVMTPSYSEGFCFAAAESIALGIPLISSGKAALAEVVSGKHITMTSQDSEGLLIALEKAYLNEWDESPIKEFPFEETLRGYLKLYE
jgi:glycosyltransferase involved in cell wall biosynthesis